jgi:hypothetical protein
VLDGIGTSYISTSTPSTVSGLQLESSLDTMEEFRVLALEQSNFRKITQENLEKLLEQ